MAKRELLRKIDQEPSGFTSGSFIAAGGTAPHRMLSPTHSDSDAGDVPVNGDLMVFSDLWKALSLAEVIELLGGLFVGRYEGAHAGLFAYDHEDGTAIEFQVTDTGGQPFVSAGAVLDVPNTTWIRIGYPEYDQIMLADPTSGATDPEQHRGLSIPASAVCGVVPDCLYIADSGGFFPDDGVNDAFEYLVTDSATHLLQSGEWVGAQTQPQWFTVGGYFGSGVDFAGFDESGVLTLHGQARAKREIYIPVDRQTLGGSAPTRTTRAVGASGNVEVPVISFSNVVSQETFFEAHIPATCDGSVNVEFHLMWFPGAGWSAGNYMWKLDYLVKDESGESTATGTPTTIQASVTPSAATDVIETEFGDTIDAGPNQTIWCRLWRDVANDNADGTGQVRFAEIEFTVNSFGEAL